MTQKKKPATTKKVSPPTWLRKDCRARFRELVTTHEFVSPELLARMAHVSVDLEAAELEVQKHKAVTVGTNGIPYVSAYAKNRDGLAAEFRLLAQLIAKEGRFGLAAFEKRRQRMLHLIQLQNEAREKAEATPLADVQRAEAHKRADFVAKDYQREQAMESAQTIPLRKKGG